MPRTSTRSARSASREFTVKVGRSGSRVHEVIANSGDTVEDALGYAEVQFSESDRIKVNGRAAQLDSTLKSGDIITLTGKISGGVK